MAAEGESPAYRDAEQALRPWLVGAAVAALPGVWLSTSKSGWEHALGLGISSAVWLVFVVEIVRLLGLTADRPAWLLSHKLEVAVAVFASPLLPLLGLIDSIAKALPVLVLVKVLKLAKLVKLARYMGRAGVGPVVTRLVLAGFALAGVAVLGVLFGRRSSAGEGLDYVVDEIDRELSGGATWAALLVGAGVVILVECLAWWFSRRGRDDGG